MPFIWANKLQILNRNVSAMLGPGFPYFNHYLLGWPTGGFRDRLLNCRSIHCSQRSFAHTVIQSIWSLNSSVWSINIPLRPLFQITQITHPMGRLIVYSPTVYEWSWMVSSYAKWIHLCNRQLFCFCTIWLLQLPVFFFRGPKKNLSVKWP